MTYIHRYSIIHRIFIAFSRMSQLESYSRDVGFSGWLLSLNNMLLRFPHVFLWLGCSFFFFKALNNMPLSGCTIFLGGWGVLRWAFIDVRGLSLVAASGDYSSLWCTDFSLGWLLLLQSMGSRHTGFSSRSTQAQQWWHAGPRVQGLLQLQHTSSVAVACGLQSTGSVVVVHRLSCSAACGIFPHQGSNPCPLH